jgi:hypothetical protein
MKLLLGYLLGLLTATFTVLASIYDNDKNCGFAVMAGLFITLTAFAAIAELPDKWKKE